MTIQEVQRVQSLTSARLYLSCLKHKCFWKLIDCKKDYISVYTKHLGPSFHSSVSETLALIHLCKFLVLMDSVAKYLETQTHRT